jgi:hypothetical protein
MAGATSLPLVTSVTTVSPALNTDLTFSRTLAESLATRMCGTFEG